MADGFYSLCRNLQQLPVDQQLQRRLWQHTVITSSIESNESNPKTLMSHSEAQPHHCATLLMLVSLHRFLLFISDLLLPLNRCWKLLFSLPHLFLPFFLSLFFFERKTSHVHKLQQSHSTASVCGGIPIAPNPKWGRLIINE